MGGKSSAPPPPDYAGAANATAQGNLEAARAAAAANRVNQYTPYGNLVYSHDQNAANPDEGWSATQTLSPEQQQMLNKTNTIGNSLLNTAQTGLGYVDQSLGTGGALDESKIAQMPIQGQSVQDAVMSRLQPQLQADQNALENQLANQGIPRGSEAWNNAMRSADQKRNDLYTQAALQGINTGLTARQQGIQEQYTTQDRPLNIINALRTGNQIQNPNFVNVPQQSTTQGADLLSATGQQYAAKTGVTAANNANTASTNNALMGAGLAAAAMFF